MLDLDADLSGLRGADYNPRSISAADLADLAESIRVLGIVKPLIARNDLLVAGHQRTLALRSIGITRGPLYRLSAETTIYDEVRFNQLHNGTGLDAGDEKACITGGFDRPGWHVVESSRLRANFRGQLAGVRDEIAVLIRKYGPWGGVVATIDGRLIHAAQYALAAFLTGVPLTVHVVAPEKIDYAVKALGRDYGVFDYSGLGRSTSVQSLAQMYRLRGDEGQSNKSWLYEDCAAPIALANPSWRWLDFGAGHGDYAATMRRRGLDFHDVEFFRRGSSNAVDVRSANAMIDRLCADLSAKGPYDAVICDSVLNSVDSIEAQDAVMVSLNAFAKLGGRVFFSGRPREIIESNARTTKRVDKRNRRAVEFLDRDGLTAIYRAGHWFFQMYHARAEVRPLAERFGLRLDSHTHNSTSWQAGATKIAELPGERVEAALAYEFDLPIGQGQRIGRANDAVAAYRASRSLTCI